MNLPDDPDGREEHLKRTRQLQKYQAGLFLIVLSAVMFLLGAFFDQQNFHIIGLFLLGAGIVFQFDKNRPKGRWY